MKRYVIVLLLSVAAVAAAGGGVLLQRYLAQSSAPPPALPADAALSRNAVTSNVTNQPRPDFTLPDVDGKSHSAADWDGQVLLVNFWASWCPPCVKEMPALNELYLAYRDKGFSIIGIALDEQNEVRNFIDPMGIDYPILVGDEDGLELSQDYGNRLGLLPFSVFVGRDGRIVHTHPGEIDFAQAEAILKPLL